MAESNDVAAALDFTSWCAGSKPDAAKLR